jgi:hypothetical protein
LFYVLLLYCSNLNVWEQANPNLLAPSNSVPVSSSSSSSSSSAPVSWASLLSSDFDTTASITPFSAAAAAASTASTSSVSSSSTSVPDSVYLSTTEQANSADDAFASTTAYGDAVEALEHSNSSSDSEGEYDDLDVTAAAVSAISAQKLADEDNLYAQEEVPDFLTA